jgi:excisionase family DNA binding protein
MKDNGTSITDIINQFISDVAEKVCEHVIPTLRDAMQAQSGQKDELSKPLRMKETAQFLGIPTSTLSWLVHEKRIPFHKVGKPVYFFKEELIVFIKSGKAADNSFSDKLPQEFLAANNNRLKKTVTKNSQKS